MAASKKTQEAAKSTAKQDVAGRRVAKKGEPALASYVERKVPTRIQEFADYLERETGYAPDLRTLYLGSALRGTFQKSEENQARLKARQEELAALREERAAKRAEREAAKADRAAARAAKADEPVAEKAAKAPAAKAPRAAKAATDKAAAAKPARRRPAKPAATDEEF